MGIREVFMNAMSALWSKIATFLPNLFAGIVIIIIGYFAAKVVRAVITRIATKLGIDKAGKSSGVQNMLDVSGVRTLPSELIGQTAFLFIFLVFLITAAETFGLRAVSGTIDSFVLYLPKVIAAVVIALAGLFFAQILRDAVRRTTTGLGVEYANALGGVAYGVIVLIVAVVAIGQLEIDTRLLHLVISIVLSVIGLATAIALGFGSRSVASNIVNGVYAREALRAGTTIEVGDTSGEVVSVGSVTTIVKTKNNREVHIPNAELMRSRFETSKGS